MADSVVRTATRATLASTLNSAIIAGDHIYVFDQDGVVRVYGMASDPNVAMLLGDPHSQFDFPMDICSSPVTKQNVIYVAARNFLYAIRERTALAGP